MVGPSQGSNSTKLTSSATTIKFLCSYGGKILPRHSDGKLRYHGGETRVLAVHRSISFAELLSRLGEMCGAPASLRCQLPTEDLDALVSITSDEDLANLIEEYDRASLTSLKIRACLSAPKSASAAKAVTASSSKSSSPPPLPPSKTRSLAAAKRPAAVCPLCLEKSARKFTCDGCHSHGNASRLYLIHNGNHWQ